MQRRSQVTAQRKCRQRRKATWWREHQKQAWRTHIAKSCSSASSSCSSSSICSCWCMLCIRLNCCLRRMTSYLLDWYVTCAWSNANVTYRLRSIPASHNVTETRMWANTQHRSRIRILRFFSFLKFNEFYEFFSVEKIRKKNRNFANHRCLTCFDVLECNVHL